MIFDINVLTANYPMVVEGLLVTLRICLFSLVFGTVGACFLCLGKLSGYGVGYHVSPKPAAY